MRRRILISTHPISIAWRQRVARFPITMSIRRFLVHKNGKVELYDQTGEDKETINVADQYPEIVKLLKA